MAIVDFSIGTFSTGAAVADEVVARTAAADPAHPAETIQLGSIVKEYGGKELTSVWQKNFSIAIGQCIRRQAMAKNNRLAFSGK